MPPQLEDIREKMADHIHDLWAMDKIELGWTHGPVMITYLLHKRNTNSWFVLFNSVLLAAKKNYLMFSNRLEMK